MTLPRSSLGERGKIMGTASSYHLMTGTAYVDKFHALTFTETLNLFTLLLTH
jgi:hypothetical protein